MIQFTSWIPQSSTSRQPAARITKILSGDTRQFTMSYCKARHGSTMATAYANASVCWSKYYVNGNYIKMFG